MTRELKKITSIFVTVFGGYFTAFGQSVVHVDDDAGLSGMGSVSAPFQTIQMAIQAVSSGDTIKVADGTYTENARVQNKSVILLGGFLQIFPYGTDRRVEFDGSGLSNGVYIIEMKTPDYHFSTKAILMKKVILEIIVITIFT